MFRWRCVGRLKTLRGAETRPAVRLDRNRDATPPSQGEWHGCMTRKQWEMEMDQDRSKSTESNRTKTATLDAVVIGAGIAGLYQLYRARELGLKVRAFEAGSGVGGTW